MAKKIDEAIRATDIVLVILSKSSVNKEGVIQREIKKALDIALEKPESRIFLIPLKIEECPVPSSLSKYQWLDYFGNNKAHEKLLKSLRTHAETLGVDLE